MLGRAKNGEWRVPKAAVPVLAPNVLAEQLA